VLFVGRLVEKKGCEYLIKAAALVTRIVPDARFVVVGDGALKDSLTILARKLGVQVEFRGALSSAQVQTELAEARVLCLPSVTAANGDAEGFGLILLEAQASGVPVVTSAKGGKDEGVRDGETGLTFDERDVDALARWLVKILTDDKIATSFALAGPKFVSQTFDIRLCTQALETLYDSMARHEICYPPSARDEATISDQKYNEKRMVRYCESH
jgi:glycosyltransferase involved in cell wall biosynthesis